MILSREIRSKLIHLLRGAVVLLCLGSSFSYGQKKVELPGDTLPMREEFEIPTAKELTEGSAVDWIIKKNGQLAVVEPIAHRPFVINKQLAEGERLQQEVKKARKARENFEDLQNLRERTNNVYIVLPDLLAEENNYFIEIKKIEKIIHFEDLIMERIKLLSNEGDFRTAFDLLLFLTLRAEKLQKEREKAIEGGEGEAPSGCA